MVELSDIIDMFWVADNNPIYIWTDDGEVYNAGEDDLTNVLTSTVSSIDVYSNKVEIYLED